MWQLPEILHRGIPRPTSGQDIRKTAERGSPGTEGLAKRVPLLRSGGQCALQVLQQLKSLNAPLQVLELWATIPNALDGEWRRKAPGAHLGLPKATHQRSPEAGLGTEL